jgi:threonine dehydratase
VDTTGTSTPTEIDRARIDEALARMAPLLRSTPILSVPGDELGCGADVTVHLKLEHLQHSGSFKARGALNAMTGATIPEAGVVAASGGNHGAAVAWAARRLGVPATIFVPSISSPSKIERMRAAGAEVRIAGDVYAHALEAADAFAEATRARSIHAYDEPLVVTGAGTVAPEIVASVGSVDDVVVACGGGGLAAGLARWFGPAGPHLHIVETETTATFAAALAAGGPVDVEVAGVAADSLGAGRLGTIAWSALGSAGASSVLVGDGETMAARRHLWDSHRLLIEPAAAAAVAAVTSGRISFAPGASVAVILCGANTVLSL